MMKRILALTFVLAIVTGLFAQAKPEFSLKIRAIRDTFSPKDAINLDVTTTNLTGHRLNFSEYGMPYTYVVRRNGAPVAKTTYSPWLIAVDPKGLAPHRSVTGDLYVNQYVDMSQPGKYTIQLEKDGIKSNIVTVEVEP